MVRSYISIFGNIFSTKISGDACEMIPVFKIMMSIYFSWIL